MRWNNGRTQEKKFIDSVWAINHPSNTFDAATGTLTNAHPLAIPQGTGVSGRLGRKVILRNINARWTLKKLGNTLATGTASMRWRLLCVRDKQCNGSYAAPNSILANTSLIDTFMALENQYRYDILFDKQGCLDSQIITTTNYGETCFTIKFSKKCFIPIEYSSDTSTNGDITSLTTNNIVWYAFTANESASPGTIQGASNLQIRYRFDG